MMESLSLIISRRIFAVIFVRRRNCKVVSMAFEYYLFAVDHSRIGKAPVRSVLAQVLEVLHLHVFPTSTGIPDGIAWQKALGLRRWAQVGGSSCAVSTTP
jgi:hypothetical protein